MSKMILASILSLFCTTMSVAQDNAICGDWVGVYKSFNIVNTNGDKNIIDANFKRYIRIKVIDSRFTVRMKTRIADNTEPFNYWSECQIIEADSRQIKWKMDLGSDYDWSSDSWHKRTQIGHTDYNMFCTVTLLNGTLMYSEYMMTTYFDRSGREIDRENTPNEEHLLYKDEDDW